MYSTVAFKPIRVDRMRAFILVFIFLINYGLCKVSKDKKAKTPKNHGYFYGAIPGGKFEYEEINGHMSPDQAVEICEADLQCAGFTYHGVKIPDIPHQISFFR